MMCVCTIYVYICVYVDICIYVYVRCLLSSYFVE